MINAIKELNFPEYATLSQANVVINDMGERTISTQVKIEGSIIPDFSYDWEIEFKGEKYIHPLRKPQALKGNESINSVIDLTFQHYAIYQLKRYYFVELTSIESGTAIADKYVTPLALNIVDFVEAFNRVLDFYFDGAIKMELNPNLEIDPNVKFMSISYSLIWEVLQKFYEAYKLRWDIVTEDGLYKIKVGYPSVDISHTFEYGYEGGLLKIERQVQDPIIKNILLGRGGSKNLPYRYFKKKDDNNPLFEADPDWIPELSSIYFSELRGKTFRDYVQGWKTNPNRDTQNGIIPIETYDSARGETEQGWAYKLGHTDKKFRPIEYVKDDLSISEYGFLQGALQNNEEIYPSIQGYEDAELGRIDEVVAVEQMLSDNVDEAVSQKATIVDLEPAIITTTISPNDSFRDGLYVEFEVRKQEYGNFVSTFSIVNVNGNIAQHDIEKYISIEKTSYIKNLATGEITYSVSDRLEQGKYRYYVEFELVAYNTIEDVTLSLAIEDCRLVLTSYDYKPRTQDSWDETFDIWIKNIWGTNRSNYESDEEYYKEVWEKVIGTHEAKVCFSTGMLAHEDYDFIIKEIHYDPSQIKDGVMSEWRLTLLKSDAELEATGYYIPNSTTGGNAKAGDFFYFIDIDMPHQYVLWAEERLDAFKISNLNEYSDVKPSWVVRFDKIRLNEMPEIESQLIVGSTISLKDKRFIHATQDLKLHISTITYTLGQSILPEIEIALTDKVMSNVSVMGQMQSKIDVLSNEVVNLNNIEYLIRNIGDKLFLRKDGISDISNSPTRFRGEVAGDKFTQGIIGGADWGIYRDQNGLSIAEFDKIIARKELTTNSMVVNQISSMGGTFVISSASMECIKVEELEDSYKCYFDQKNGSISNQFVVNDIAYCQISDPQNHLTKYYKRVVVDRGLNYISLSKTIKDGDGIPTKGDNLIQFGYYSESIGLERQSVIIISSYQGGSIKLYNNVNSFDISDKNFVGLGVNPNTNRAYIYGYGDIFFGDRDFDGGFITYQIPEGGSKPRLSLKADVEFTDKSTGLSNLTEFKDIQENVTDLDYLKRTFPFDNNVTGIGALLARLLAVQSADGNIVAGLYGGGSEELFNKGYTSDEHGTLMFFAGAKNESTVAEASTRIYEDGTIYTNSLRAEKGGTIGGFEIGQSRIGAIAIENGEFTDNMSLYNTFIKFSDSQRSSVIGTTAMPSSTGLNPVGRFVNKSVGTGLPNYGLIIDVQNGRNEIVSDDVNIAIKANGNIVANGVVSSFSLNKTELRTPNSIIPLKFHNNTSIVRCITASCVATFPSLSSIRTQLGLTDDDDFSVRFTIISHKLNATSFNLVGRGYSNLSAEYPYINDATSLNITTPIKHDKCDVSEWQLVYESDTNEYNAYRLID